MLVVLIQERIIRVRVRVNILLITSVAVAAAIIVRVVFIMSLVVAAITSTVIHNFQNMMRHT